jgi:hypothetical protein
MPILIMSMSVGGEVFGWVASVKDCGYKKVNLHHFEVGAVFATGLNLAGLGFVPGFGSGVACP